MNNSYRLLLKAASDCSDEGIRFNFLVSIQRSVTQVAMISTFEIYRRLQIGDDGIDVNAVLNRLHAPTDGDPVDILDQLIPRVRSLHWPSFATGWFEPLKSNELEYTAPLVSRLNEWVSFRNDRPGHGVMDRKSTAEWAGKLADLVQHSLAVLSDCLPNLSGERSARTVWTPEGDLPILTPLYHDERPVVIRKFRNKRGLWSVDCQRLDVEDAASVRIPVPSGAATINFEPERSGRFVARKVISQDSEEFILANVPTRQSSIFEGRERQVSDLSDWIYDRESRACLVYGDGGVGKTTLVLEVINNLLEDAGEPTGKLPEVISFYSAKLTKWTETGIVHFRGISPAIEDAIRELLLCVQDVLGAEWYRAEGRALIDKVAATLGEVGLKRDDIILILDNTETLARRTEDEEALGRFVEQISRKVARVLVTSRRREKVEAKPIELLPLLPEEGAKLLARLAVEYHAGALEIAGEARLRKVSRDLGGKPLLLDVLSRHIALTGGSINDAYAKVMRESAEGLSEFLYEDAWMRIAESHREIFLVLTCISVPISNESVSLVCKELEVPHTEWLNSFYETHFGQMTGLGSDYYIQFEAMALDFFAIKLAALGKEASSRVRALANRVDELIFKADRARREFVSDRVSEAFRCPAAKAAKVAAAKNDLTEAKSWYLEAVNTDPHNSYLHDRFAWFLLVMCREPKEAEKMARRAVTLDQHNADANLTLGLTLYHQGRLVEGDQFIGRAVAEGKPESLGLLRKGIARFHAGLSKQDVKEKLRLLQEAALYLQNAMTKLDSDNPFFFKNIDECEKYSARINSEVRKIRARRGQVGHH